MDSTETKVVAAYVVMVAAVQREIVVLDDGRVFGRWAGTEEWEAGPSVPI